MEKSDTPQDQDSTAKETNQSKNKGTIGKAITPSPKHTPTVNKDEETKVQKEPVMWPRLKRQITIALIVEILIFAVTIKIACIYSGQLHTQIRAIMIDNRPWIAIENFEGHIRQPDPFFWTIPSLRNSGKSPALDTVIRGNYKIFPKDHVLKLDDIEFRGERRDSKEWNTYHAGAFNLLRNYWTPKFQFEEEISSEVWEQLMKGDKVFYVFFDVKYDDVFGRPLETRFCAYYLPRLERHEACGIYNDITSEK